MKQDEQQQEAAKRPGTGRPKKGENSVQLIEPSKPKDNSKLTDSKRAKAAGTNRTYVKAAEKPGQKIVPVSEHENKTAHKAAELFNTNRTYVNQAVKNQRKEAILRPMAKANQKEHGGTAPGRTKNTSGKIAKSVSVDTRKEASKLAGVGELT